MALQRFLIFSFLYKFCVCIIITDVGLRRLQLNSYHSHSTIERWLAELAVNHPHIAQRITLRNDDDSGLMHTHEGRYLDVIKIGRPRQRPKPAIWIDAGMHAREWISVGTAVFWINLLISNYQIDKKITQMVDEIDWYIIPVLNPDGYEYTRNTDRMWRKNRRPTQTDVFNPACGGVDLNRNFDWFFGGDGASKNECEATYHGPQAFSEPETRAIRNYLPQIQNLSAYISLHSAGQLWLYPFGHKKGAKPNDWKDLQQVASGAQKEIRKFSGNFYNIGSKAEELYLTTGSSVDYVKGFLKTKYVYLIELPPRRNEVVQWQEYDSIGNLKTLTSKFMLPEVYIIPTAVETWLGITILADRLLNDRGIRPVEDKNVQIPDWVRNPPCWNHLQICDTLFNEGHCHASRQAMTIMCPRSCRFCK